jgi:hypothetical protein
VVELVVGLVAELVAGAAGAAGAAEVELVVAEAVAEVAEAAEVELVVAAGVRITGVLAPPPS